MNHPWDEQRIAQLESSLERCMYDHGCVCTEMHQFRRERDALAAKLARLIEAASRVSFEWGETPADLGDCDEAFVTAWQEDFRTHVHEMRAAIAEAKR